METESRSESTRNRTTVDRPSDRELVVTRTFNAPARIVYDVWTKPELLKRWWAPKSLGVTLFDCQNDVRVGGRYRFAFGRDPRQPMVFSGSYSEVDAPKRLVCTQAFEQAPSGEAVVTATFTEHDGKTTLVLHQLFPSKQVLDGVIATGMEKGMRETYEQLEELVGSLR
jgi:uncharacterized protein YndB with AHSA1/START domain